MRGSITLSIVLLLTFVANSNAAIIPAGVSATGPYNNPIGWVTDGFIPVETTFWQSSTVWWSGTGVVITVDLGQQYVLQDILVSVDNNDGYQIQYSADNSTYTNLFTILPGQGEIGGGMDTFNTLAGDPEYWGGVDFTPVVGRYVRIFATHGDSSYSVGELQVTGVLAGVPEPASLAIWGGLGIAGLVGVRRRKQLAA
jgi:hypothetical protein